MKLTILTMLIGLNITLSATEIQWGSLQFEQKCSQVCSQYTLANGSIFSDVTKQCFCVYEDVVGNAQSEADLNKIYFMQTLDLRVD